MAIDKKYINVAKILGAIVIDWFFVYVIFRTKNELYARTTFIVERKFSINDQSISYPYLKSTEKIKWTPLKNWVLAITGVILFVVEVLKKVFKRKIKDWRSFLYDGNQAFLGLYLTYLITNIFCDYIKNFAGRLRPSFLAVCDVDFEKVNAQYLQFQNVTGGMSLESYGPRNLFDASICKGDPSLLVEERRSFPSGHTSFTFTTMTYLTLYLAGQLRLYHGTCRVWKYVVCSLPLFFAVLVPFSRLMDYRHHWEDVVAGALIGFVFALTVYYFMYPPLRDENCDTPINRSRVNLTKQKKVKVDDDEEVEIVDEKPKTTDEKPEQMV